MSETHQETAKINAHACRKERTFQRLTYEVHHISGPSTTNWCIHSLDSFKNPSPISKPHNYHHFLTPTHPNYKSESSYRPNTLICWLGAGNLLAHSNKTWSAHMWVRSLNFIWSTDRPEKANAIQWVLCQLSTMINARFLNACYCPIGPLHMCADVHKV